MTAPPTQLIGQFGEYFASQWLKKDGYEVRRFWDFYLKLKYGTISPYEMEEPIPEEEERRRSIESLEARIPQLEERLKWAEGQTNPKQKVKNWITYEREHLRLMRQALTDLKDGKPLQSITEDSTSYPATLRHHHPEPWQLYEEVATDSEARQFLGPTADAFMKYLDECESLSKTELGGTMFPDIVAKKDGNIYIVEVKANDATLAPLQRRALDLAAEHSFRTKVIRVRFDAHCAEEEVWKRRPHTKAED